MVITRRLPQTDEGRNTALDAAKQKKDSVPPAGMVLSAPTVLRLDNMQPLLNQKMLLRGAALEEQTLATARMEAARKTANMYIRHFFQSFNNGVDRGLFPAQHRAFYQLSVSSGNQPDIDSDADIATWGNRILGGDPLRIAAGGAAMGFPDITEITTVMSEFTLKSNEQSNKKNAYDNAQEEVEALREDVDLLILRIWDEVETAYNDETPSSKRRKAAEWGVVYVSSNGGGTAPGTDFINIPVDQTTPSTVSVGVSGKAAATGTEQFKIDFGDGNSTIGTLEAGVLTIYPHTYLIPGQYNIKVTALTAGALELFDVLQIDNSKLFGTVTIPVIVQLSGIQIPNNLVTKVLMQPACYAFLVSFILYNNAMDTSSVNENLIGLDNSGLLNGIANFGGGTNNAPSGLGIAAKNSLIAKGWTVLTN